MRELVMIVLRIIGRLRALVSLPFTVAQLQARLFGLLPNPPLTTGQVDLDKANNVTGGTLPGLRELNIIPKAVEEIVPTYLRGNAYTLVPFPGRGIRTHACSSAVNVGRASASHNGCNTIGGKRAPAAARSTVVSILIDSSFRLRRPRR
jgi:hypothetical protein